MWCIPRGAAGQESSVPSCVGLECVFEHIRLLSCHSQPVEVAGAMRRKLACLELTLLAWLHPAPRLSKLTSLNLAGALLDDVSEAFLRLHLSLSLKIYLFEKYNSREKGRDSSIHWFTPYRAIPAHMSGPSSPPFPGRRAGSWIQKRTSRNLSWHSYRMLALQAAA